MKNRKKIMIIPLVLALFALAQTQCFASNTSVNDPFFLDEIPNFTQINSGKENAWYKIYIDNKLKVIQLKLTIQDENFGKTDPEISVVFFDQNNTQIFVPSSAKEIKNDKYSCVSYFEYFNKSKTANFNIEITLLSPLFDQVFVNCVIQGETHKVCDFVELGFDFSPHTKPSTTKVTTTKSEKSTTTKNATNKNTAEKTTTIKSTSSKNTSEKSTTEKSQKGTNKPNSNGVSPKSSIANENVDGISVDNNSSENFEEQQLEVTKLEKPSMNAKAKTSLTLAFGIGTVAIITVALALVANNKMRKNQVISIDETETDKDE